ncbi:MAG: two-component regulator propeller domain-containing protein, partial [Flexibacteraceae bacterium]
DCVHLTTNAAGNKLYASLWGMGLLIADIDKNGKTTKYEVWDKNFPLNSTLNSLTSDSVGYTRITSTAIDLRNQLFIGNFTLGTSQPGLHRYNFSDRSFTEIQSPDNSADSYECPIDILVADNNDKWVRIAPNRTSPASIWVVSDQGIQRSLNTATNNGGLPSETVNDMAKDIDGSIWVGTNIGVAVFYSPSSATRSANQPINAITPIFEGRPLLEEEQITAVAIDGGGRKWFGTKRNGVYLYDKDISRSILFFNTDNSPLPSNNIIDIAINKLTGEVFISTENGIVSFRYNATDPTADGNEIVVYPNPVRPEFNGLLGIRGLPANSQVKITDIAGRKVFEGNSNGGGFSWNLKDYNNRRAKTGIYLVYASDDEGTETLVGKFAVVE